jgi:hypothetical protein
MALEVALLLLLEGGLPGPALPLGVVGPRADILEALYDRPVLRVLGFPQEAGHDPEESHHLVVGAVVPQAGDQLRIGDLHGPLECACDIGQLLGGHAESGVHLECPRGLRDHGGEHPGGRELGSARRDVDEDVQVVAVLPAEAVDDLDDAAEHVVVVRVVHRVLRDLLACHVALAAAVDLPGEGRYGIVAVAYEDVDLVGLVVDHRLQVQLA